MRSRFRRRIERSICSMPARRPLVQTFVATKALSRAPPEESNVPTTSSALPYIGELSTTWPPALNNASSTLPRCAIAEASRPTSNPSHVPQPTTGSAWPLEGIVRVCMPGSYYSWRHADSTARVARTPRQEHVLARRLRAHLAGSVRAPAGRARDAHRSRREAARLQDRIHQSHDLGTLRCLRADLGNGLR